MKTLTCLAIFLFLVALAPGSIAQTNNEPKPVIPDTLITNKNEKLIGKITKVTETDFEYRRGSETDGPVYTVSRDKIREVRWSNGTKELIMPDEMDVNVEAKILDKRSAIKFHFFSIVSDKISFSYEHSLKVGVNLEATAGLINNSMVSNSLFSNQTSPLIQGGLACAGVKFLLGQDYYIKGMKYAHPLKGRFIKPEILYAGYTVHGVSAYYYNYNYYSSGSTSQYKYSDEKVNSLAFMINYGRQVVLGNVITMGYTVGLGYSFASKTYTDPNFLTPPSGMGGGSTTNDTQNGYYYTHINTGVLAYSATFTIGYLFK
ncbi:MAG: hypothetical protein ACHQRM_08210 [Bacteroidia bacterium]